MDVCGLHGGRTVNSESSDNRPHRRKWCRPGTVERQPVVCNKHRCERHYDKTTFPSINQRFYHVVLRRVVLQWKLRALQPPAGSICTCIIQSANFSFTTRKLLELQKVSHTPLVFLFSSCIFLKCSYGLRKSCLLFLEGHVYVAFSKRNSHWHTFYFDLLKIHFMQQTR